jgi:hypothetical protein
VTDFGSLDFCSDGRNLHVMFRPRRQLYLFLFLATALAASCAQVTAPDTSTSVVSSPYPPLFKSAKYAVGVGPVSIVVADFNGDGKPDIATANRDASTVSILVNNGDGTFQKHVDYATGKSPAQVVAGDFNNDGKVDLAVASGYNSISILLGNGDGTFGQRIDTLLQGAGSLSAFDLNNDGKLDLVVGPADVSLLGNGDGTFQAPIAFHLYYGGTLSYVLVTQLNGLDLVGVMNDFFPYKIEELAAEGGGTWLNYSEWYTNQPAKHGQLAAGDINGDHLGDIAAAWFGENAVFLCLSNSDGILNCGNIYKVGMGPIGIALADLTGNNLLDVVTANSGSNNISFLRGHGDYTLGPLTNYAVGKVPQSVGVADFDGNGRQDLAVANSGDGTVTTLLQSTAALSTFSLSFGKQAVGTTSPAKTVTLFNAGLSILHISKISTSGDFSLQSNGCGTTLASSASCKLSVVFKPTVAGTRTGGLFVADDALGSPQRISLSGKGI